MKPRKPLGALLATTLLVAVTAHTQTWDSENVLLPSPGYPAAGDGHAVLIDPFTSAPAPGVLVGFNSTGVGNTSILRLTPNDSSSSSFSVEALDNSLTTVTRLAYNDGDALYAAGNAPIDPRARSVTHVWKVRKSTGQGNSGTWTGDDTFILAKNAYSSAWGMTADYGGNVFASGVASDGKTPHWIVRRKIPGGLWTTVYDVKGNNVNMIPAMCFFPGNANNRNPAVFTVSDLSSKWTVMRSQNQGASGTWQPVDSWTGGGAAASAYDAVCDAVTGNIYVIGCRGLNGNNPSGWVIRMSSDGGNSWTTLLDVAGSGSWASRAAIDGAGNVSISGVINPTKTPTTAGTPLWKVIRCASPQTPSSWLTSFMNADTLPFGQATSSRGRGIAADPAGNLFATGMLVDWSDNSTIPATTYPGSHVGLLRLVPTP